MDEVDRQLEELATPLKQMLEQEANRQHELLVEVTKVNDRMRRIEKTLATLLPSQYGRTKGVPAKSKPSSAKQAQWVPSEGLLAQAESFLRDQNGEATSKDVAGALGWNSGKVTLVMRELRNQERVRLAGTVPGGSKLYKLFSTIDKED